MSSHLLHSHRINNKLAVDVAGLALSGLGPGRWGQRRRLKQKPSCILLAPHGEKLQATLNVDSPVESHRAQSSKWEQL